MPRSRGPASAVHDRPSRRTLAAAGALAVCGFLAWYVVARPSPPSRRGPIIVMSIDTLRADRLPAYGYAPGRTPAIDALVADGVLFERAYTHSPLTLPAHVSILSGRLPQHHGVRDNVGFSVKPGEKLLPQWLRERGYATAGVVSSAVLRDATGIGAGFDFFDGRMPPARGGAALDEAQREGEASLAIALEWVQRQASREWFFFLHVYEPHAPYSPPERYGHLAPYDGEIAYADEIAGRFLDRLRGTGLYDASTIVLLSDHGEGLGDHGEQEHGLFLYEEALRVPLVVKLPGRRNAGSRVPHVVQHVDLLPTILALAGAAIPPDLPGRSLRELLEGEPFEWPDRSVYSETLFGRYHFGWSELFALTDARFRYIQAPRPELYDLQADPRERHNLAEIRRPTAVAIARALAQVMDGSAVEKPEALAPDVRDRLASLGYVGPQSAASRSPATGVQPDPKDKVHVLVQYRSALQHVARGRLGEAVDLLRHIGREEPAMADVWHTIGRLLVRQGQTREALDAFRELLRREPTSVAGLLDLASVLLTLERLDEAREHAELAATIGLEREPADAVAAYEMLARIALAHQDGGGAQRYAGLAERVDPGFPLRDYVDGRLAYAAGRFGDASAAFARAVRAIASRTGQMRGLHLYAGDSLAHLERFAEAEREFSVEIRLFPDNTWAYLSLANLYGTFGRFDDADRVLEAMVQAVPSAEARAQAARLRTQRAAAGGRP
ncbi:MAG: sulfatase-like hydrolase/transferase [Vicinamibacterales bacterium]